MKLKIAFDVNGTLTEDKVKDFYRWCLSKGHDVWIWSNSYISAMQMAEELGHNPRKIMEKETKYSLRDTVDPESYYFDLCVDDCITHHLASFNLLSVLDIEAMGDFNDFEDYIVDNGLSSKTPYNY
jgi:hypothetical protein